VFGIFVPEMESAVRACGAESPMNGVEGDRVHRVNVGGITHRRVAVAFEGEVETGRKISPIL